jgi:predicted nucleic acid-binding protein
LGLIYLDSSVLIDAIGAASERGDRTRERLAHPDPQSRLVTSPLVDLECMVRPLRQNNRSVATAAKTILSRFRRLEITAHAFDLATHIRAAHGLSVPDSLHFATASLGGCDAIWTFDRALLRVAPDFAHDPLLAP